MLAEVLGHFPAHTYALTVVSDPDRVLADEAVLAALQGRGFGVIDEPDGVALRYALCQRAVPSAESPLIVMTTESLDNLPYDLWQVGRHVELALHRLFPRLDYPTIRQLTPQQRGKLGEVVRRAPVRETLSARETAHYLLRELFGVGPHTLADAGSLVVWLAEYHAQQEPLPPALMRVLVAEMDKIPAYQSWPTGELLADGGAFRAFVQAAWSATAGRWMREEGAAYAAGVPTFESDGSLQDALPQLLRLGMVTPVAVDRAVATPTWSKGALVYDEAAAQAQALQQGFEFLAEQMVSPPLRWEGWQQVAQRWAALTCLRYGALMGQGEPTRQFADWQEVLNEHFGTWLTNTYGLLSGQRLPVPHHLFHVPGWLDQQRAAHQRVALVVLDGMSLAAWQQIRAVWSGLRPGWQMEERLVLAQVPSITAISRQALISGLPPSRFEASLLHNQQEATLWSRFWQGKLLPASAIAYEQLAMRQPRTLPASLDDRRVQALCLVVPDVDRMVHGATLGVAEVQASLAVWLQGAGAAHGGMMLLQVLERLLQEGYLVALTSDHGHVEASGMGQPREGVTVASRAKRARLYKNQLFAAAVQHEFPDTQLWYDDGMLPPTIQALMPTKMKAFAPLDEVTVSHGGLTLEEMVVPLVVLRSR